MTENNAAALFDKWNDALKTKDPEQVAALYDPELGILVPTLSNKVRHNLEEIEDYFVHFCAKGPVSVIDESNIRILGDIAINSGLYTFNYEDGTSASGRFTFVYRDGLILEHHSSLLPE